MQPVPVMGQAEAPGEPGISWRGSLLAALIVSVPLLCFAANLLAWAAYGIDMPYMDDWRAYQTGQAGSFDLGYLFQPANDTLFPVGLFLDSLAQRVLGGNSVAYQLLSMTLVLGLLLWLQWRLLRHVLGNRLLAACAFSATLFMLQPGSYWGLQDMAYHQAVPLVAVLFALHVVLVNRWHAWLSPALLLATGLVAGLIYISGAFAVLTTGVALLVAAGLRGGPERARLARGGGWLTLVGIATSIPQLWVILIHQKGTHRPDAPMAYPTDADFWFYLLGKLGRSLMLPMDHPAVSLGVVGLALAALAGAILWAWRASRQRSMPGDAPPASVSSPATRAATSQAFVVLFALAAVVAVYLAMVSAGRTNLRPDGMDLLQVYSFAFHRFHFFWATLLWPWLFAVVLLALHRWRPALAKPVGVVLAIAVIVSCASAGVFAHRALYESTGDLRVSGIKCIRERIEESRPIVCDSLVPADLSEALRYAERIDASFARILDFTKVTVLPINPDSHEPLALGSGDVVTGGFASPHGGNLASVGLFVGNYGGLADGSLSMEVCAKTCARVSRQVGESVDNDFFVFDFAQPLHVSAGEQVSFSFSVTGSSHPLAVWIYASVDGSVVVSGVQRGGTQTLLPGQTLRLAVHYLASREGPARGP